MCFATLCEEQKGSLHSSVPSDKSLNIRHNQQVVSILVAKRIRRIPIHNNKLGSNNYVKKCILLQEGQSMSLIMHHNLKIFSFGLYHCSSALYMLIHKSFLWVTSFCLDFPL